MICPVCYPPDYIGPDGNVKAGYRGTITSEILTVKQPDGTVTRQCQQCGYKPEAQPQENVMPCTGKHTKYQPTDDEFKCPACGKGHDDHGLCIDEWNEGNTADCTKLHADDFLLCYSCNFDISGAAFAARLAKAKSLIPCSFCKGKGMVSATKPAGDIATALEAAISKELDAHSTADKEFPVVMRVRGLVKRYRDLAALHEKRGKGFTIIELMITVAVIGIIAAMVIPNIPAFRSWVRNQEDLPCQEFSFQAGGNPVVWLLTPEDRVLHLDNRIVVTKTNGEKAEVTTWTLVDKPCPAER